MNLRLLKRQFDKGARPGGISIRTHASLYFAVFCGAMVLAVMLVLLLTNNIVPNMRNITTAMEKESGDAVEQLHGRYGAVAAEAINLSTTISAELEAGLKAMRVDFSNDEALAAAIPELLDREIDLLQLAIERADCSGAFVVLDATVNPGLPGSEASRAGLYIRRLEPKRLGNPSEMLFLRGYTALAIRRGMTLQSNWDLEFDITDRAFWSLPLQAAAGSAERKLINLHAWSFGSVIPKNRGISLLCSVPLLATDGSVLGVCGIEITETNFRARNEVNAGRYPELALVFSQLQREGPDLENAFFAGSKKNVSALRAAGTARFAGTGRMERAYIGEESYRAVHGRVSLYPESSYFADRGFAVSVLLPESAYNQEISTDLVRCVAIFAGMLLLSFVLTYALSRRLGKPLSDAAEAFKNRETMPGSKLKVGIRELDELLQLYANPDTEQTARVGEMFADFLVRLELLTPRERAIVALYAEGKTQEEIRREMVIAPSTLKTHNSNIYAKLGVRTFEELQLYLGLISRTDASKRLERLLETQ